MNGLEAIRLMEQGKMVTSEYEATTYIFEIIDGNVCSKRIDEPRFLYQTDIAFNFSCDYQEYIEPKPLIGWERIDKTQTYYYINGFNSVDNTIEANYEIDKTTYEKANYFSTKEKAEEINFKQTLFRKLQRFSDENGGNEIDCSNLFQEKFGITYNCGDKKLEIALYFHHNDFGQVYFISEEIAEKAIELFHDELIKYFTYDWENEE